MKRTRPGIFKRHFTVRDVPPVQSTITHSLDVYQDITLTELAERLERDMNGNGTPRLIARYPGGCEPSLLVATPTDPLYHIEEEKGSLGTNHVYDEYLNHGADRLFIFDKTEGFMERLLIAARDSYRDLEALTGVEYVHLYKTFNSGIESDGRMYAQMLAFSMTPPGIEGKLKNSLEWFEWKDRCRVCDAIRDENRRYSDRSDYEGPIISIQGRYFAMVPHAPKGPNGINILSNNHDHNFSEMTETDISDLSSLLYDAMQIMDNQVVGAYSMIFFSRPVNGKRAKFKADDTFHPLIQITTAVSPYEIPGTGVFLSNGKPEDIAAGYRRTLRPESLCLPQTALR